MSNKPINDQLASLSSVLVRTLAPSVKKALSKAKETECCSEHSNVPKSPVDWAAIDNLVAIMFKDCMQSVSDILDMHRQLLCDAQEAGFKVGSVETVDMLHQLQIMNASVTILSHHYNLVRKHGRGPTADIHYDRIQSLTEDQAYDMLRSRQTKEMLDEIVHSRKAN